MIGIAYLYSYLIKLIRNIYETYLCSALELLKSKYLNP